MGNNITCLPASLLKEKSVHKARDLFTGIKKRLCQSTTCICISQLNSVSKNTIFFNST